MKRVIISFFVAFVAVNAATFFADITCPPPGDCPVYFPDPTNCSRFYECSGFTPKLLECPPDLVFNPDKNVCDFDWNYHCDIEESPIVEYTPYEDCSGEGNIKFKQLLARPIALAINEKNIK